MVGGRAMKEEAMKRVSTDTLPKRRPGASGITHPVSERDAGMVHPVATASRVSKERDRREARRAADLGSCAASTGSASGR